MTYSQYDNLDEDNTKWETVCIRISPRMKERLKLSCKLNEIDISELTRLFWQAWLSAESSFPRSDNQFQKLENSFERIRTFFHKGNSFNRT